jgi:hypothetical protein
LITVKREEAVKRHIEYTGQLSTQCRALSLGLLAFVWALMTTKEGPLLRGRDVITDHARWNLIAIALVVILALVFDAAQYFAGLKMQDRCLEKMSQERTEIGGYDEDGMFRLQDASFWAKLIALGLAVAWLLFYLGLWFL